MGYNNEFDNQSQEIKKPEEQELCQEKSPQNPDEKKFTNQAIAKSADFFVILSVAGFFLGVIAGFSLGSIPICIIAGTVAGALVGIAFDNRKDKKDKNQKEKEE